ncbi:DUF551 domain-containing protein [Salmonella enterica subsp. enterica serovar Karamoja]|uniref:DUF551 domain-containing protein n=1 Tax=Salmonella enterica subsp. enterica serovar Karamoja TaxID=2500153 RepID=A0A3Q9MJC9_SALET|nr:DUF551 domain-containing protein [Salmonella enterica subsp. enterica serovar Karamoja]AZT42914.1 DUF551 domain-containing protein [Salmonella enterica subsp. enterica serovar Karamoja]
MTITKERLLKIQRWRETYGADSNVMLPAEEAAELARIALASLEVAPVGEVSEMRRGLVMDGTVDLGGKSTYRIIKGEKAMKRLPLGTKFYIAPPAPVVDADPVVFTDERNLHHIAMGRETSLIWGKQNQEVGDIPLYRHAQPVPVDKEFIPKNLDKALGVVGVALPESKEEFNFQIERWIQRLIDRVIRYADEFKEQPAPVVPEECPAELPYAQVKAAADLYALCWQSGEVVTYTPAPEKATIWLNNYSGTCVQEYVKLERLQEALSGYSPVIPGGWISCSERIPDNDESKPIAIFTGKCLGQGMFVATYDDDGFFDYWEGMEIIGVTHWMPLPAPPQEVNRG